jgi:hypothetical protein
VAQIFRKLLWHYEIVGWVSSLLAAALYQGNPDRQQKRWNIVSKEIYIPYAAADGMLLHINEKLTKEISKSYFVEKFSYQPNSTINF